MKIWEIINKIIDFHPPLDFPEHTCDTIKCGNPENECTGIGITCYVSMDVIRQAKERGINLLITHEPTFYNHDEKTDFLADDPIYQEKAAALEDAEIVVWRDHDHIHGPGGPEATTHPYIDYIFYGIARELGWEAYAQGEETKPLWFSIPQTTVHDLAQELMEKFNLTGVRIVGDPDAAVSTVYLCEHVRGGEGDRNLLLQARQADAIIPLEIIDWTLAEYIRDAAQQGRGKAIIEMGHFNTEELGMKYMVRWLPDVIGTDIPVEYLQSGDSFHYILRKTPPEIV